MALYTYWLHVFSFRVSEKEFLKAFKSNPRLKTKVNNFHRQMASSNTSDEDFVAIRPEWTMVDRIIACRFNYLEYLSVSCKIICNGFYSSKLSYYSFIQGFE